MYGQSDPAAYALYDQRGKSIKYRKMLKTLREADVVLFGEQHNDPIAHWLQQVVARDLHSSGPLVIGMEMLEADQQAPLDRYLAGSGTLAAVDSTGEGLWNNFPTDYQPLVDFAKAAGISVIATNIPRRLARIVFRQGFAGLSSLPKSEKAFLPPLPIPYDASLPGYQRMLEMMPGGHGGETFPMAQASKDATMGYRIVQNKPEGHLLLHLNGSYHSDDFEGIGWYIRQYAPEWRVVTITTVTADDVSEPSAEALQKAHFTLVVPALMTKTY